MHPPQQAVHSRHSATSHTLCRMPITPLPESFMRRCGVRPASQHSSHTAFQPSLSTHLSHHAHQALLLPLESRPRMPAYHVRPVQMAMQTRKWAWLQAAVAMRASSPRAGLVAWCGQNLRSTLGGLPRCVSSVHVASIAHFLAIADHQAGSLLLLSCLPAFNVHRGYLSLQMTSRHGSATGSCLHLWHCVHWTACSTSMHVVKGTDPASWQQTASCCTCC